MKLSNINLVLINFAIYLVLGLIVSISAFYIIPSLGGNQSQVISYENYLKISSLPFIIVLFLSSFNDRITLVERDNNVNLWKRKAFVTAFSPNRTHNTGIGSSIVITQGEVAVGMGNYTYGLQRCNGVATTGGYRDFSGAIAKFQFDNVVGRSARMGDADENSLDAASVETLSPNPSMGESVTFQSASEILNVTANNQNGTVSDLSFKGNQINVSALIPGIYVLKIETATGVVVKKLSVQ